MRRCAGAAQLEGLCWLLLAPAPPQPLPPAAPVQQLSSPSSPLSPFSPLTPLGALQGGLSKDRQRALASQLLPGRDVATSGVRLDASRGVVEVWAPVAAAGAMLQALRDAVTTVTSSSTLLRAIGWVQPRT